MAEADADDAARFSVGEVVRLASGGPDMTVEAVPQDETSNVVCVWFAPRDGAFCRQAISVEALTHRSAR